MVRHKKPKHVHTYTDNRGKKRCYFARPGQPTIALPLPMYTEAWWIEYHRALEGAPKPLQAGVSRTKPGSMAALIADFYASPKFVALADETQRSYRSLIEHLREQYGELPVAGMKTKHVDAILAPIAARSKPQAYKMRKWLIMLLDRAVKYGYRPDNPARLSDKIDYTAKGWEPWTEADIAKFRAHWPTGSPQRIAFEILLNSGLRRADAVKLGPQHRDGNRHIVKLRKSGETVTVHIPIRPELQEQIGGLNHLVYIVTRSEAARSDKSFTNWIIEAARAAGLPEHRSPHGLRKAICRRLTEAGNTPQEISAITGQSIGVIERYIRDFNREAAAEKAMASIKDVG